MIAETIMRICQYVPTFLEGMLLMKQKKRFLVIYNSRCQLSELQCLVYIVSSLPLNCVFTHNIVCFGVRLSRNIGPPYLEYLVWLVCVCVCVYVCMCVCVYVRMCVCVCLCVHSLEQDMLGTCISRP